MISSVGNSDNNEKAKAHQHQDENATYSSRWKTTPKHLFCHLVQATAQHRHEKSGAMMLPLTVHQMKARLLYMVQLNQGHLDPRHFVYGKRTEDLRQLFTAALSTWIIESRTTTSTPRLVLRRLTLPLRQLTAEQAHALARVVVASSPHLLYCVELDGGNRLVPATVWQALLPGLATAAAVQKLSLRGVVLSPNDYLGANALGIAMTRWKFTLRELRLVDCVPAVYRIVSQALSSTSISFASSFSSSIPLHSITLNGPAVNDVQAAHAMASLLTAVPKLGSVTFSHTCDLDCLLSFLPPTLPWKTIRLPTSLTKKSSPPYHYCRVEDLVDLLQRSAANVQHLEVSLTPPQAATRQDVAPWSDALSRLETLQSLTVHGSFVSSHPPHDAPPPPPPPPAGMMEWITSCPTNLRRLGCPNIVWAETLVFTGTRHYAHLQSLHVDWTTGQDWFRIWQIVMETDPPALEEILLNHIGLQGNDDDDENNNPMDADNTMDADSNHSSMLLFCEPFQRTLMTKIRLTSLSLYGLHPHHVAVMDVLANILASNECFLQTLRLQEVRNDLGSLWQALPRHSALTSLTLGYAYHSFATRAWPHIVELIPKLVHVHCLTLDMGSHGVVNRHLDVNDLARALEKTPNLTLVRVLRAGDYQPQFDFVCRVYSKRNCIEQIIQQGKMPLALWPGVLESLAPNPSAIFAVAKRIPFPSLGGSNHGSHYALQEEDDNDDDMIDD